MGQVALLAARGPGGLEGSLGRKTWSRPTEGGAQYPRRCADRHSLRVSPRISVAGRLVRMMREVLMRSTHSSGGALRLAGALGLCLLAATPLHAQTTSASVFGSVNDTQGGMLPGATVTLTSRTQANTLTTTSDAQGRFVFPIVRPDAYTLRVSMEGFKTLERTNVVVNANDRFSDRSPHAGGGRGDGGGHRHRPRQRAAGARAASARTRWRTRPSRTSPTTAAPSSASRPSCRASFPGEQLGTGRAARPRCRAASRSTGSGRTPTT